MSSPETQASTQLDLFKEYQLGATHLSRCIPLWDLLPIFLFRRQTSLPEDTPISQIPTLEQTFTHRGEQIEVRVRPAILEGETKGTSRVVFPGEREQLVTAALRALGVSQRAKMGTSRNRENELLVTIAITIRQLQAELHATGHSFSHRELVDALSILAGANASVSRQREGQEPIETKTGFLTSYMRQGDKYIVTLNILESQQIFAGAYRVINYARFMHFDDPIARWLYQYIHAEHRGAKVESPPSDTDSGFWISLDLLMERGLLNPTRELRKSVARVRDAFDMLAAAGVLQSSEQSPGYDEVLATKATRGRSQITGARWRPHLSERDVNEIIDENAEAKPRNETYRYLPLEQRLALSAPAKQRLVKNGKSKV